MIFLLLIMIVLIMLITGHGFAWDWFNPVLLLPVAYFICVIVYLLNVSKWGDLAPVTVLTVTVGILAYVLGCGLVSHAWPPNSLWDGGRRGAVVTYSVRRWMVIAASLVMILVTYKYYQYTLRLSVLAGGSGAWTNMLSYARTADSTLSGYSKIGALLNAGLIFSRAVAYISGFVWISNRVAGARRRDGIYLIPIVIYLVQGLFSTGRTPFMNYVIFLLLLGMLLYRASEGNTVRYRSKGLMFATYSIAAVIVFFLVVGGTLRGSIYGTEWSGWYQVSKYVGSPLGAFNYFLLHGSSNGGSETSYNLLSLLNHLGFQFEIEPTPLEFVSFGDVETNIYTALRRYVHDYGLLGMTIIQFIIGFVYESLYMAANARGSKSKIYAVIYCALAFAVIFNPIEERFLINIISLNNFVLILMILTMWKYCLRSSNDGGLSRSSLGIVF